MDTKTAEILCKTTADFYRVQAASFQPRTAPCWLETLRGRDDEGAWRDEAWCVLR